MHFNLILFVCLFLLFKEMSFYDRVKEANNMIFSSPRTAPCHLEKILNLLVFEHVCPRDRNKKIAMMSFPSELVYFKL